jgi:hypothetical protein
MEYDWTGAIVLLAIFVLPMIAFVVALIYEAITFSYWMRKKPDVEETERDGRGRGLPTI